MNQRKLEAFYRKANKLVFANTLPKDMKIVILCQDTPFVGRANASAYPDSAILTDKSIWLNIGALKQFPSFLASTKENIKRIMLHEMVHFAQYMACGKHFSTLIEQEDDVYHWHDQETFDDFGAIAVANGLITYPNLIG